MFDGSKGAPLLRSATESTIYTYYDAFGTPKYESGATDYNPFRYAGYYYDSDTGLYYLINRYYNPAKGRFMSEDPYWNVDNMLYGQFTDDVERQVYCPASGSAKNAPNRRLLPKTCQIRLTAIL